MKTEDRGQGYQVASIGLDARDRRVAVIALAAAASRQPPLGRYDASLGQAPDVIIVDADNDVAMRGWRSFMSGKGKGLRIATILIGDGAARGEHIYRLSRPLVATRLLALLERAATEVFEYQAPMAFIEEPALASRPAPASGPAASGAATSASISALVVDDSLPVRVQLKIGLKNIASHVDFAESAEEAMTFLESRKYDVVFLDVILPGMDGYELCRWLKRRPESRDTPVIMLTSNASPADRVKGKLAGCETYLIKPVRQSVFEVMAREFVEGRAAA